MRKTVHILLIYARELPVVLVVIVQLAIDLIQQRGSESCNVCSLIVAHILHGHADGGPNVHLIDDTTLRLGEHHEIIPQSLVLRTGFNLTASDCTLFVGRTKFADGIDTSDEEQATILHHPKLIGVIPFEVIEFLCQVHNTFSFVFHLICLYYKLPCNYLQVSK